jgi:hypothetical protein
MIVSSGLLGVSVPRFLDASAPQRAADSQSSPSHRGSDVDIGIDRPQRPAHDLLSLGLRRRRLDSHRFETEPHDFSPVSYPQVASTERDVLVEGYEPNRQSSAELSGARSDLACESSPRRRSSLAGIRSCPESRPVPGHSGSPSRALETPFWSTVDLWVRDRTLVVGT